MFKIGLTSWIAPLTDLVAIDIASEFNINYLQIDLCNVIDENGCIDRGHLEKIKKKSKEVNVSISGVGAKILNQVGMVHNQDSLEHSKCCRIMLKTLEVASYFKASYVFFPSFRKSEIKNISDLTNTAKLLKWICNIAKTKKINIGSENSLDALNNQKLVSLVNEDNFLIAIDTYNPCVYNNSASMIISHSWPNISSQVHVKDGVNKVSGSAPLGKGDGDFFASMNALRKLGFSGAVFLENRYDMADLSGLKQDIETIRSLEGNGVML